VSWEIESRLEVLVVEAMGSEKDRIPKLEISPGAVSVNEKKTLAPFIQKNVRVIGEKVKHWTPYNTLKGYSE